MFGDRFSQCFTRLKRPSHSTRPAALIPRSAIAAPSSCSCSCSCYSSAVFKSFNSLYDPAHDCQTSTALTSPLNSRRSAGATSFFSSSGDCQDEATVGGSGGSCPSERDLCTAIASRRLLLARPGKSNSIVDNDTAIVAVGVGSGVAVGTYAPDPYWEFRRSMEEMVAALKLDVRKHRAHLHELLLCYLALNRKHAHKYIVGAFTDLLLGLTTAAADE